MRKYLLSVIIFMQIGPLFAQETEKKSSPEVTFMGFLDTFYSADFSSPPRSVRQPFLYHHNRHNEFNVNLALMHLNVNSDKYRANIGLQAGTYAVDNYAAEAPAMRAIYEANVGIALNSSANMWLDVGIFPSHLGFASALSMDNYTLTRSLVAENSPYFLSGAKLTYEPTDQLLLSFTATNGWQRIARVPGNSMISIGTQISYQISESISFNWSTFYGTEDPDPFRRTFLFNNLYSNINMTDNLNLIVGVDIGSREQLINSSETDVWYAPTAIISYRVSEKWHFAGRMEIYNDPNEVIISTGDAEGFEVTGLSGNIDYSPSPNVVLRGELRSFMASGDIFEDRNGDPSSLNLFITTSLAIKIGEIKLLK